MSSHFVRVCKLPVTSWSCDELTGSRMAEGTDIIDTLGVLYSMG